MEWAAIAIVHLYFNKKPLIDKDLQPIEQLLRQKNNIYNLNIHERMISFYLSGKKKFDYVVLDQLRDVLRKLGYKNFEIVAEEYVKSAGGYKYVANDNEDI